MKRCILFFLLILSGCAQKKKIEVQRSFYYWKSIFTLSHTEQSTLDSLSIRKLYIKFFDVDWNKIANAPVPQAQIQFKTQLSTAISIIPVVFITNETLLNSAEERIDTLGKQIANLVQNISENNALQIYPEVQIDCDWTAKTKEKYFWLLKTIRQQPFLANKELSASIRLHQLKFIRETGIPPVDKGLVMCYNMGNLGDPQVSNSILDVAELRKYIGGLKKYPLKLDVALPVFDWYVWFRKSRFKGLIQTGNLDERFSKSAKTIFEKDSTVKGYSFEKGDWLRYEDCSIAHLKQAAKLIRERLQNDSITVILYHLDDHNLSKYSKHEMEDLFNCFY